MIEDIQSSFWPGKSDGAEIHDPAFPTTCVGEMPELSKYLNHAEFLDQDRFDERRLGYAKQITRIAIEHNLIILWQGANTDVSNFLWRFGARPAMPGTRGQSTERNHP